METKKTNYVQTNGICTISLQTMGFITWLVFLILKVTGAWDVDWFWVWFPLWMPIALAGVIFLGCLAFVLLAITIESRKD